MRSRSHHEITLNNGVLAKYGEIPDDLDPDFRDFLISRSRLSRPIILAVIDMYDGNATQTAKLLGVSTQTVINAIRLPQVREQIMGRRPTVDMEGLIADREERQAFWTATMRDPNKSVIERLKASELLGRSQCDFSERQILEGQITSLGDVVKTLTVQAEPVKVETKADEDFLE